MYCCRCNLEIDDNSTFCKYCGTKQKTEEHASYAYILREWHYHKPTDSREDRSVEWETFYLFQELATEQFKEEHYKYCERANKRSDFSVSPITYSNTIGEANDLPINSLPNIIASFDYYHQFEGRNWRSRIELVKAILIPELTYNPNLKNHLFSYRFEEYVIIDDSKDIHRGYLQAIEVYTDETVVLERLEKEVNHYGMDSANVLEIHDERDRVDDDSQHQDYYWVVVKRNGHATRLFTINKQALVREEGFFYYY